MGIVTECLANIVNDLKKELKSAKAHIVILQATNDDLVKNVNYERKRYKDLLKRWQGLDPSIQEIEEKLSEK